MHCAFFDFSFGVHAVMCAAMPLRVFNFPFRVQCSELFLEMQGHGLIFPHKIWKHT